MSTVISASNQTLPTPIDKDKDDPTKACCTIPPDTDPGPIKP